MEYDKNNQFTEHVKADYFPSERYERVELEGQKATETAIKKALEYDANIEYVASDSIPEVFGERWKELFLAKRDQLIADHEEKTADLVKIAARYFEYSRWRAAGSIASVLPSHDTSKYLPPGGDRLLNISTPDGYADYYGWANLANDEICNTSKPKELLSGFKFAKFPPDADFLVANSLIWFFEAANLYRSGDLRAMDVLAEATTALHFAAYIEGFDAGKDPTITGIISVQENSKKAADARHAENREIAEFIKDWYRENQHFHKSLDAAATAATKVAPIKFRTARKHIGEAAKKLRSASKA